jgi:hypothetical protein
MLNYKRLEKSNDLAVGHRVLSSISNNEDKVKVKQSRYRPGVAQRVPGI